MKHVKNVRASDQVTLDDLKNSGFVIRKRTLNRQISQIFMMVLVIVVGISLIVYNDSYVSALLCVGIGGLIFYLALKLDKMGKIEQSNEFVMALLSSALGRGYAFCAIVRDDGQIVYLNRPFQEVFPAFIAQEKRDVCTLLSLYNVSDDERGKITALISGKSDGTLNMTASNDGSKRSFTLTIEAIERPTGFVMLRGK